MYQAQRGPYAEVDQAALLQAIVNRLERLSPTSPTIDLAPAEVVAPLPALEEAIDVPKKKPRRNRAERATAAATESRAAHPHAVVASKARSPNPDVASSAFSPMRRADKPGRRRQVSPRPDFSARAPLQAASD